MTPRRAQSQALGRKIQALLTASTDAVSRLQALGASEARAVVENGPERRVWLIATFDWPVTLADIPDASRRCGGVGADLLNLYVPYHRS